MAIFGFKKRKDEKLEQEAQAAKSLADKKSVGNLSRKATVKKSDAKTAKKSVSEAKVPVLSSETASNFASIIIRPRVTEKSGLLSQDGVYTFEVSKNSNKAMVKKAIVALYKVTPTKVAVINTPMKNVFIKGRKGTIAGVRKAVVTVKKGEKIDFV